LKTGGGIGKLPSVERLRMTAAAACADGHARVVRRDALAGQVVGVGRTQAPGLCGETIHEHVVRRFGNGGVDRAGRARNRRGVRLVLAFEGLHGVVNGRVDRGEIEHEDRRRARRDGRNDRLSGDDVPIGGGVGEGRACGAQRPEKDQSKETFSYDHLTPPVSEPLL